MASFLITGINGQDASFAEEILTCLGVPCIATTRTIEARPNSGTVLRQPQVVPTDYSSDSLLEILLSYKITHVLHLAGQTYVSKSWDSMVETVDGNSLITASLVSAITQADQSIRLVNASSSEIFSPSLFRLSEESPYGPTNPYGASKLLAHSLVKMSREWNGIWASNAILFPHESTRRRSGFLFQKLKDLSRAHEPISFGDVSLVRDWGFAPEYVAIMILVSLMDSPCDLNICTGNGVSISDLIDYICSRNNIPRSERVCVNKNLFRVYESPSIIGDNSKISLAGLAPRQHIFEFIDYIIDDKISFDVSGWLHESGYSSRILERLACSN